MYIKGVRGSAVDINKQETDSGRLTPTKATAATPQVISQSNELVHDQNITRVDTVADQVSRGLPITPVQPAQQVTTPQQQPIQQQPVQTRLPAPPSNQVPVAPTGGARTIQAPKQQFQVPTQQITSPTVTRNPVQITVPDTKIDVKGPSPIDWENTEVASAMDEARAISTNIAHKAAAHAQMINSTLNDLAQPNEYLEQLRGMEFQYDPMSDPEYVRSSSQLENQIMQSMNARGGMWSSVAQATLQSSMIDLQLGFRAQRHTEFLEERQFTLQMAQFEEGRRSEFFNRAITSASFELESLQAEYGRVMDLGKTQTELMREQWSQQMESAKFDLQKQVTEREMEFRNAQFQASQIQQEFENNIKIAMFEFDKQQTAWENNLKIAMFEFDKQQTAWENAYKQELNRQEQEWKAYYAELDNYKLELESYRLSLENAQIEAATRMQDRKNFLAQEEARTTQLVSNNESYYEKWAESGRADNKTAAFYGVSPGTLFGTAHANSAIRRKSNSIAQQVDSHKTSMQQYAIEEITLYELDHIAEIHYNQAQEKVSGGFTPPDNITRNTNPAILGSPQQQSKFYTYQSGLQGSPEDIEREYNRIINSSGRIIGEIGTNLYERLLVEARGRMYEATQQAKKVGMTNKYIQPPTNNQTKQ